MGVGEGMCDCEHVGRRARRKKKDNIPTEAGGQVEGGEKKYGQGFDGFQVVLSSLGGKVVSKCVQTRGERPSPGVENRSGVFCFCVGVG